MSITFLFKRCWQDESGSTDIVGLIFITAIVGIAGMVGLVQIRDQVTQQFGDVAVALDNVDQSFSYTIQIGNPVVTTITSSYVDNAATLNDPVNAAPACLTLNVAPTAEGGAITPPTGEFP